MSEDSRKLWPFFFIIPILGLSVLPIGAQGPVTCTSNLTIRQCGTFTATFSTATQTFVTGTVTFPSAFTSPPRVTVTQRGTTNLQVQVPSATYTFFAVEPVGITWPNMPVATTEIFGDTGNHWISIDCSKCVGNGGNTISWEVNCQLGSNSATALLRPQYSLDGGATWNELAAVATLLDIHVDNVSCPFVIGANLVVVAQGLAVNAISGNANVLIRIVGINGGGVGDNPIFNIASLTVYTPVQLAPICGQNLTPTSASFSWRCLIVIALGSFAPQSVIVEWQADE